MNDKRYFYTDPLAAAWQSKHYGMQFTYSDGREVLDIFGGSLLFYVHPESLNLLTPHVGDLVGFVTGYTAKVGYLEKRHPSTFRVHGGIISTEASPSRIERIIQRNGIPFMWPESDESLSA